MFPSGDSAGNGDPVRPVLLVITGMAFLFVVVLLSIQFGGGRAETALTVPLVLGIPVGIAVLYWFYKSR